MGSEEARQLAEKVVERAFGRTPAELDLARAVLALTKERDEALAALKSHHELHRDDFLWSQKAQAAEADRDRLREAAENFLATLGEHGFTADSWPKALALSAALSSPADRQEGTDG